MNLLEINLCTARGLLQYRDKCMLEALQEIAASDNTNGQLSYIATKALKEIGEI